MEFDEIQTPKGMRVIFNIDSSSSLETRRVNRMNRMEMQLRNEPVEVKSISV